MQFFITFIHILILFSISQYSIRADIYVIYNPLNTNIERKHVLCIRNEGFVTITVLRDFINNLLKKLFSRHIYIYIQLKYSVIVDRKVKLQLLSSIFYVEGR